MMLKERDGNTRITAVRKNNNNSKIRSYSPPNEADAKTFN
jgi:hypothetical protein